MCDPVSLTVASVGVSAAGSLVAGADAASAGRGNAAALRNQAILREEKAKLDVENEQRRFVRQDGAVRNQIAASGVSTASFSDVLNDSLSEKELALETIKWGAKNDANNLRYQADGAERQAKGAQTASFFNAAGAVVGGVSNYYKVSGLGKTSISGAFARGDL